MNTPNKSGSNRFPPFVFAVLAAIACGPQALCQDSPSASSAALALDAMFNPSRSPSQRTMGLLQRSFLDLVESSRDALQIALVVDGTDSMAGDITGVRSALQNMAEDLRKYRSDRVSFGLVVYRDSGARSGELVIPLRQFTNDATVLDKAFSAIQPETGAPYFPELPDLGIHQAINELPWSDDPETSRWLLLFGDAPPYDPDFQEAATGARRRYDTDVLVQLARRKSIQISCVLCTSREAEQAAYQQVLDKTRQFMNTLATQTGGLMLDLSYPDIRGALAQAAQKQRVPTQRIGRIARADIESVRAAAASARSNVAASRRIRLAVLPHAPLDQITFDPSQEAVQIATELRMKFQRMPCAEVASPVDVERSLRRLKSANTPQAERLQALAVQLRADFVVWGSYRRAQGIVQVKSAMYGKSDGAEVAAAEVLTGAVVSEAELAGNVARKLLLAAAEKQTPPELAVAAAAWRQSPGFNDELITPVANIQEARTDLLAGFEALEQSLAYPLGSAEGKALLEQAEKKLKAATNQDPRNPLGHLALASCDFNWAQSLSHQGRKDEADAKAREYAEALKRAFRERDNTRDAHLKTEIQADHALLIKKDHAEAIRLYESLADVKSETRLHIALRAHWMLVGILSGDWGVDPSLTDPAKAREHIVQILAHWGDSSEAAYFKRQLRWDEEKGQNQFEHLPRENRTTLAALF